MIARLGAPKLKLSSMLVQIILNLVLGHLLIANRSLFLVAGSELDRQDILLLFLFIATLELLAFLVEYVIVPDPAGASD